MLTIKFITHFDQLILCIIQITHGRFYLSVNTACVVAFKAESRDGKTLDISGEIVDDRGNIVQNVKSLYNGLGYFNIYPNEGRTYYLNCKSTEGIEKSFTKPSPSGYEAALDPQ